MRISRQYKILGATLAAWAFIIAGQRACDNHYKKEYKQKIEQTDPKRYQRVMQQTGGRYVDTWHKEYLQMKDSLRVDSFYKEGYKAGQQSIRDSLKKLDYNVGLVKPIYKATKLSSI